ncbi:isoform h [Phytophthora cinnamomi]|uniref:isoform h n=1 Tax=Phytophthora cinnamomi TaxID=4785 RepID=UPI00355AC5AC|nr:isoform h [Phytophthora cinnamomi]
MVLEQYRRQAGQEQVQQLVHPSHGPSSSSPAGGGGIMRRATWADKIRDKLPPLDENEYEVLWERGVLGVIFLESEKDGIPYVSKATESCISPP